MSSTLKCEGFNSTQVTRSDIVIASLAGGFTLGFGFLTTWTAMKQTALVHRRYGSSRLNSPYVWMIWLEILVCLALGVICWLHLQGIIPSSFGFLFFIVTCSALQIHFLLQIIINRISILLTNRSKARILKYGIASLITTVNILVYCTWIPGRLQQAEWETSNNSWDYCEKVIYLITDACLNLYFMYIIQKNLIQKGLVKYERLLRFNKCIIGFSLSMDCLIIGIMSLNNSLVYIQFHPLAYMVKLNIEMAMTELMTKVSCSPNPSSEIPPTSSGNSFIQSDPKMNFEEPNPTDTKMYNQFYTIQEVVWRKKPTFSDLILDHCTDVRLEMHPECKFSRTREVHIQTEQRRSFQEQPRANLPDDDGAEQVLAALEQKSKKIKAKDAETASLHSIRMVPMHEDLGSQTKIWGPAR